MKCFLGKIRNISPVFHLLNLPREWSCLTHSQTCVRQASEGKQKKCLLKTGACFIL